MTQTIVTNHLDLEDKNNSNADNILKAFQPISKLSYVPSNQTIVSTGQQFQNIYIVKSGYLKSILNNDTGTEKILHFYSPGDVIGLESLNNKACTANIVTIEASNLKKILIFDFNQV